MRNLILALAATAALCASGIAADAMPAVGTSNLVTTGANPAIEKTVVIVRRTVIRRPARTVCTTIRRLGRVVRTCRTIR